MGGKCVPPAWHKGDAAFCARPNWQTRVIPYAMHGPLLYKAAPLLTRSRISRPCPRAAAHRRPIARISAAARSAPSDELLKWRPISYPALASSSAIPRPMPVPAPVTSAILFMRALPAKATSHTTLAGQSSRIIVWRLATALKWMSRETRTAPCSSACAASQMSLMGIGVPAARSDWKTFA